MADSAGPPHRAGFRLLWLGSVSANTAADGFRKLGAAGGQPPVQHLVEVDRRAAGAEQAVLR